MELAIDRPTHLIYIIVENLCDENDIRLISKIIYGSIQIRKRTKIALIAFEIEMRCRLYFLTTSGVVRCEVVPLEAQFVVIFAW